MSDALMVYFSQGGTTARVARAIGEGLLASGYRCRVSQLAGETPPSPQNYDVLGIGFPVYVFRPPFNVIDYVQALPDLGGLPCFVFALYGIFRGDAGTWMRRALHRKGGRECGYFTARGAEYYLGYLRRGYLFSPDHPTPAELAQARAFGAQLVVRAAGAPYTREPFDLAYAPVVHRAGRTRRLDAQASIKPELQAGNW